MKIPSATLSGGIGVTPFGTYFIFSGKLELAEMLTKREEYVGKLQIQMNGGGCKV